MNEQINELIASNHKYDKLISRENSPEAGQLRTIIRAVIEKLDFDILRDLKQESDSDKILSTVDKVCIPAFVEFFKKWEQSLCPLLDPASIEGYISIAREFFVRGFRFRNHDDNGGLQWSNVTALMYNSYDIHLEIDARIDDAKQEDASIAAGE